MPRSISWKKSIERKHMGCYVLISKHDNKLSPLTVLTLLHRKKLFVPSATYNHMNFLEFFFQAWLSLSSSFFSLKETSGYEVGHPRFSSAEIPPGPHALILHSRIFWKFSFLITRTEAKLNLNWPKHVDLKMWTSHHVTIHCPKPH